MGDWLEAEYKGSTYGEALAEGLQSQGEMYFGTGAFKEMYREAGMDPETGWQTFLDKDFQMRQQAAAREPQITAASLGLQQAGPGGQYLAGREYVTGAGEKVEGARQMQTIQQRNRMVVDENPYIRSIFEEGKNLTTTDKVTRDKLAAIKASGLSIAQQKEEFGQWLFDKSQQQLLQDTNAIAAIQNVPRVGEYYDPANPMGGAVTQQDVYKQTGAEEGAFVGTQAGGTLDLLGGTTDVAQYDVKTGEVTGFEQAGFDPTTGEFQGLVPMQAQAQAYQDDIRAAAAARRGQVMAPKITEQIRAQGDIDRALTKLGTLQRLGERSTFGVRNALMGEAQLALGDGLSDREKAQIEQASRSAGVAAGRVRDIGRVTGEATALAEGDRQRRLQNIGLAQQILSGEMGMQSQEFGKALQRLGAEQATAADPSSWAGASTMAPSAGGVLGAGAQTAAGAGQTSFNPEAGLGFISQYDANQAAMEAANLSARSSLTAGLLGGGSEIASSYAGKS